MTFQLSEHAYLILNSLESQFEVLTDNFFSTKQNHMQVKLSLLSGSHIFVCLFFFFCFLFQASRRQIRAVDFGSYNTKFVLFFFFLYFSQPTFLARVCTSEYLTTILDIVPTTKAAPATGQPSLSSATVPCLAVVCHVLLS
jgi:hypothetical protein